MTTAEVTVTDQSGPREYRGRGGRGGFRGRGERGGFSRGRGRGGGYRDAANILFLASRYPIWIRHCL
ncbi:hypothetical protein NECAME_19021, partial [Necator americanus]